MCQIIDVIRELIGYIPREHVANELFIEKKILQTKSLKLREDLYAIAQG